MPHDFNKPPHVNSAEDIKRKKTYSSLYASTGGNLFIGIADLHDGGSQSESERSTSWTSLIRTVQQATPNSTTTGTAGDEARAEDSNTATATDR